jgi:Flp pilus assembly pilin Flp
MMDTLKRLLRETEGQDLAEFGVALAVVAIVAVTAATTMNGDVRTLWTRALQSVVIVVLG